MRGSSTHLLSHGHWLPSLSYDEFPSAKGAAANGGTILPKIDLSLPKKQHCTVSHKSSIKHKHSVSRLGWGEERAAGPNGCHTCRVRAEAEGGYWVLTSYTWYSGHSWGCHCHLQFNPYTPRSRSPLHFPDEAA